MNLRDNRKPKRLWSNVDELLNIAAFSCMVIFAASMAWLALCFVTTAYPEIVEIALSVIGFFN